MESSDLQTIQFDYFACLVNGFESLKSVRFRPHALSKAQLAPWLAAVWLFGSAWLAVGGEKIQISEGTGKVELPDGVLKDDLFSKPLDFLKSNGGDGGSSLIPALPAPIQPTNLRKDQFERKNWLLNAPEAQDQDAALKQILGIREYGFDGKQKTSRSSRSFEDRWNGPSSRAGKSASGRMFEGTEGKTRLSPERSDVWNDPLSNLRRRDRMNGSRSPYDDDDTAGNSPIAELNLNELLHPGQGLDPFSRVSADVIRAPGGQNRPGQWFDQSTLSQAPRSREQELRAQEFEKLLKGPAPVSKLPGDPINSLADSTRQEINPVRGTRIDDFPGGRGSALATDSLPGLGKTPRPGVFDSLNTRVLGASSLTPSVASPPPAPTRQFIPPVLEIPKRKF